MQTKSQIQSLLAQAGLSPRHRFGQNFMIDQNLLRLVADAGQISPNDTVLEIGPGTGTLTEELLSRGANIIAVEIDRDLANLLRSHFQNESRFQLIESDALSNKHALNPQLLTAIDPPKTKLISNLPYNIASPLIIELLLAGLPLLAFTVQKEVADRLRAKPDTDDYGALSVMAQLLSKVEFLRTLPPTAFWPAPKIDSALVRLTQSNRLVDRASAFSTFLKTLFSARRKTLRKSLSTIHDHPEQLLAELHLAPTIRAETLSPEQLLALFDSITTESK